MMATNENLQLNWKRRPSEIRGYERAMYTTLDDGDYIRIDYNTGENLVRLYVEVLEDKGASYYSVISNGKVTSEKNSNGKSTRVAEKLSERADEFSTLPNKEILKLINNNYGIQSSKSAIKVYKKESVNDERAEIKRKYFKDEGNLTSQKTDITQRRSKKIGLIDLFDTLIGLIVSCSFFFLFQYDLMATGAASVIWGMLLGVFDILLRDREPRFTKIFFFLISGVGIYFYSYIYL